MGNPDLAEAVINADSLQVMFLAKGFKPFAADEPGRSGGNLVGNLAQAGDNTIFKIMTGLQGLFCT